MNPENIINAVKNQDYLEFSELVNAELDRRAEEAIANRVSEVYRSELEDEEYEEAGEHEGYEDEEGEEVQEEVEAIDELSKGTLSRYIQKAGPQAADASAAADFHRKRGSRQVINPKSKKLGTPFDKLADKRIKGMAMASKRIVKEVAEPVSDGDKEFVAKHKAELKNPARYPEHQFKATTKKDKTKKASYEDGADEEANS